jgi:hypothetical protein
VTGLLTTLQEFYRDKLAALMSHYAAARLVRQYDINNAYQYIINREETQLSWVAAAIAGMQGAVESSLPEPARHASGKGAHAADAIFEEDAREAQAFVDRWRPRLETMTDARHRKMLEVILGETLEQKRMFEQARAGQLDLLGRRSAAVGPRTGEVLPTRWVE